MRSRLNIRSLVPEGLTVVGLEENDGIIILTVRANGETARCPLCRGRSRRLHSRYLRQLADLPCGGRRVHLCVMTRRFFCDASLCQRRIFAERFDEDVIAVRSRRTARLEHIVHHLGLALGGRPAAAFARRLMMPVSKDTLLRVVRRRSSMTEASLRVIGIDDWAYRRNHRYGTIVCDLERRRIISLLPDREGATIEAWLATHPGIELLSRAEKLQYQGYLRRQETDAAIHAFMADGCSIKEIARRTGHSRKLIRQVRRGERTDIFRVRQSSLDPWLTFLAEQWEAGSRNGAELWRCLRARGYHGSLRVVGEWATRRRRAEQVAQQRLHKVPSARVIARLMIRARDNLSKADSVLVAAIEKNVPLLVEARHLIERFHAMIRAKCPEQLDQWLKDASASLIASFARGAARDRNAVRAAITEPWSNGQTEGQITKLKLMRRQMYGRGKLDLLQARLAGAA